MDQQFRNFDLPQRKPVTSQVFNYDSLNIRYSEDLPEPTITQDYCF